MRKLSSKLARGRYLSPFAAIIVGLLSVGVRGRAEDGDAPRAARGKDTPATSADQAAASEAKYTSETLHGQVVWMADALRERFGIQTDDDVAHAVVALEEAGGRLHPLLKDTRGRSFHSDERLRGIELELLVRRYAGSPAVQVVRVYAIKPDGKYQVDYWCDVCSIAMYELKPCECCQGPTRLRERKIKGKGGGKDEG
jgi:hypothetical protein